MPRLRTMRLIFVLPALLVVLAPVWLAAQDDPNDAPLGDVARTLRKKTPPSQNVIDDDNLSKVMEQADGRHPPGSALRFLDRKSTRLNSSHLGISYAVFCLKKKTRART